jgi:hypothetical protein
MPRGSNFHLRFVEFRTRSETLHSRIFFNARDSKSEIIEFIIKIFTECVRTRLRRKDAAVIQPVGV